MRVPRAGLFFPAGIPLVLLLLAAGGNTPSGRTRLSKNLLVKNERLLDFND